MAQARHHFIQSHDRVSGPIGKGFLGPLERLRRWLHVGSCHQPQHRPPLPLKRNCSQPGNACSMRGSRACAGWQQKRQRQSGTSDPARLGREFRGVRYFGRSEQGGRRPEQRKQQLGPPGRGAPAGGACEAAFCSSIADAFLEKSGLFLMLTIWITQQIYQLEARNDLISQGSMGKGSSL